MSETSGASDPQQRVVEPCREGLVASDIASAAARMRAGRSMAPDASRTAEALSRAFELWRDKHYARRRDAIARIANQAGDSIALLDSSLDALLRPFTPPAIESLAARISRDGRPSRPDVIGFIMPGNVAGAGRHEIAIALVAGAGRLSKTASAQPGL